MADKDAQGAQLQPGTDINSGLPFYPADFDPGNGAGVYIPPTFDKALDIEPWADVRPEMVLPSWFEISGDFKPSRGGEQDSPPADDARSTRYVEGTSFWAAAAVPIYQFWTYEVARVCVPAGSFGILHSIDTHLAGFDPEDPTIINVFNTPNDPWLWQRTFGTLPKWHLKLERPRNIEQPGPWPEISYTPGIYHPDLGSWSDLRYAFGNRDFPLRIIIPENNFLRLYFTIPELDVGVWPDPPQRSAVVAEIGGRMRALVSNYRGNPRAIDTARRGW